MGRSGLFRGAEFSRLVTLGGFTLCGWVVVLVFFLSGGPRAAAPAPPRAVDVPPPIPPDAGPGFAGLEDKTPLTARDNPAYAELLRRVREKSPRELARLGRHEVGFAQLLAHPEQYRGVPIRIDGTALRVLVSDNISPVLTPRRRLFEAWTITKDSMGYPYCLVVEDPPADLAIGDDLNERIYFDGYFLKLMAYHAARNQVRFAPLLVGRITKYAAPGSSGPIIPLPRGWNRTHWAFAAMGVLSLLGLLRVLALFRRQRTPIWQPSSSIAPLDRIEPEALAEWLEQDSRDEREGWRDSLKDDEEE